VSEIQTYTGKCFNFADPDQHLIDINDIAHSLSNICRFNGHTDVFYSVAQHCVYVALMLEKTGCETPIVLQGLLHDAVETYIGDIPSPVKSVFGSAILELEDELIDFIFRKYGVLNSSGLGSNGSSPLNDQVMFADVKMTATESQVLMAGSNWILSTFTSIPYTREELLFTQDMCMPPDAAELAFLEMFHRLTEYKFLRKERVM